MVAMNEPGGQGDGGRRRGRDAAAGADDSLVARVTAEVAATRKRVTLQARAAGRRIEEAAGEMTQSAIRAAKDWARQEYERQKGQVVARAARAGEVAGQAGNALRAVKADNVAEYLDGASRRVGQATQYLEDHTLTQMIQDANEVARRNRAVAVGGMLVAGFALSRFLKASAARAAADGAVTDEQGDSANDSPPVHVGRSARSVDVGGSARRAGSPRRRTGPRRGRLTDASA